MLEEVRAPKQRTGSSGLELADPARSAAGVPPDLWRKSDHAENGGAWAWRSRAFPQLAQQYHGPRRLMESPEVQMSSPGTAGAPSGTALNYSLMPTRQRSTG